MDGSGGGSYKCNKKLKIEYCSRTLSLIIQKKIFLGQPVSFIWKVVKKDNTNSP